MRFLLATTLMLSWCGFAGAASADSDKTGEALAKVEVQADPAAGIAALESSVPPAKREDVHSIDAIMVAIYAPISGPAGPRDWHRFRSLMLPKSRLTESIVDEQPDAKPFQRGINSMQLVYVGGRHCHAATSR